MRNLHKMTNGLAKLFNVTHSINVLTAYLVIKQTNMKDTQIHQLFLHLEYVSMWILTLLEDQTSQQKARMEKYLQV